MKLKNLDARIDVLEKMKFMDGFMTIEEFGDFVQEFKKAKKNSGIDRDEIIGYVRENVKKKIKRRAVDELGMKDYAGLNRIHGIKAFFVNYWLIRRYAVGTVMPSSECDCKDYTAKNTILKDARNYMDETQPSKSLPTRKSRNPLWEDLEIGEVEKFVKTTAMHQVQLNVVDKKLEDLISSIRKIYGEQVDMKLKALDASTNVLENMKFMDGSSHQQSDHQYSDHQQSNPISEVKSKAKKNSGLDKDEIIGYAREIVDKEIESHTTDGLGTKNMRAGIDKIDGVKTFRVSYRLMMIVYGFVK
ncbi:hypothetical protein RD792_007898 [Penstemon davidsonii]|uniref:Uncharacterized protein n=1 Tax=Penstemon davidsonii TaxID=160366 RepID=A0ABR0D7L9_9LAMI|nr:hypothetical protein RD792_007898 [Penstemon davidsonii]